MSRIYANPFSWGKPVSGVHYLARPTDQQRIAKAMERQTHLFICGPRGSGKTSLIQETLNVIPIPASYLDCRFVISRASLIELLLEALISSFPQLKTTEKFKLLAQDPQGTPLAALFELWHDQVKQSNQKFTLVWDEIQQLSKVKDKLLPELKASLQNKPRIHHIIISHREDMLQANFVNPQDPFIRPIERLLLDPLRIKDFNRFLTQGFRRMGLSDFDLAGSVLNFTLGQPALTQHFCHSLAQLWLGGTTSRLMERSLTKLLNEQDAWFTTQWDNFGLNEKRLLSGLASGFSHPTELEFIRQFGLSATSTAYNTVLKLLHTGWLINQAEGYRIYDPLFLKWLQQNLVRA